MKIRLENFKTFTRAVTVENPTNYADVIYNEIKNLYDNFQSRGKRIRLVGVKVSNFSSDEFEFDRDKNIQREKLHKAVEKIRNKFGNEIIHRAGSK